jgi:hypothetical protein
MKTLTCIAALPLALALVSSAYAADPNGGTVLAQNTPAVCTELYQPVCGTDRRGKRVTYSNSCFARVAQATNVTPGKCAK